MSTARCSRPATDTARRATAEVCITAIETGLIGTFELHLRDDMALEWPLAETPTHMITMAFDPDLDDAGGDSRLRDMIKLICARTGISREDAYYAVQPGRRPARDPGGQRRKGYPRHAGEGVSAAAPLRPRLLPFALHRFVASRT